MKVILKKRNGKFLDCFDSSPTTTVDEFKEIFYKKYHYYPERQKWNLDSAAGKTLTSGTFEENGIKDSDILIFKDLGVQISWRLVYVIEYLGPIFIFPLFYYCDKYIYSQPNKKKSIIQILSFWFLLFHFIKREFESLFVHRFSNATMPIIRVPINCFHYWILCGVSIGYYLFHPLYKAPQIESRPLLVYSTFILLLVLEFLNLKCHLILRNLRPRGTKNRGIPFGYGFSYVSCANYFYEVLIWSVFSLLINTITAYVFTIVATVQMSIWALKKHRNYKREFANYPKTRKAIFPFIL